MNKTDIKKLYILSAAIPVLVMWIAFAAAAVFPFNPFGDRQILISDLWQQYFPFISVYWHYLRAGQIPLWSWHAGGGHDYIAHIAYYMASPFNLLAALFPHSWLRDILTIFLTFKIGLAGLFMCIFLRHITRRDDYMLAVFSALFALCGFSLAYHWNIMWMDTFAIFPIVMLGVHFLVTQGRWRLFTISLALSIIFNFYIGFFVCVFVGFLFFILAIANRLDWRAFLRRFALIAACSAIAIGMTAFIALPTFMALQHTFNAVNDINTWPANPRFYTSFFNTLGNFLPFNPSTTGHPPDVLPYFYSGMISLMFFPIFMMSKKVLIREKIAWGLVVIFMIISANHNGLNFIWHGFSFTHSLPFRYVFLISFSMVIMAARAYFLLEKIGWREIVAMAAGGGFFILMGAFGRQTDAVVIWSGVLLVVYIGIITILWKIKGMEASGLKGRKKSTRQAAEPLIARTKQLAPVALAGIILIELGIATVVFVDSNRTTGRDFPWLHANTQEILALRDIGENDFARTEFSRWWSTNDPSLYGYHGLTFFSSMVREDAGRFLQGLGLVY
ncbi:MAG: YfhO family protein, partial [Defluviitaleaceae bacterium]|nr:YfhO family protein [Defluviitaleaceae bacterium]